MVFVTLFIVAFLSGSLLPIWSEALFIYDITLGYNILLLWLVATVGNTLGGLLNYYLGLKGEEYLVAKGWLKQKYLDAARNRFKKYGGFVLLLSAAPVIGDPLTFIAGVLRYNLGYFLLFVTLSKGVRYALLALGFSS